VSIENKKEKSSPDLFKRSVKGGAWVFALRVLTQMLSLGRYVLLMNILGVNYMGLLGIAMLLMQILDSFSNTGFGAALIQKDKKLDSYLSTAWTIGIIRAFLLFAILFVAAPYFANWKAEPEDVSLTISIIRVLGLSFFIGALGNIGIIHFRKELQFHKQFIIQIIPSLISITVTVALVLIYKSVWSLVIGRLSANLFRCIFSYAMHPFRPKLQFQTQKAREMWQFGKWVMGSTIIGFLAHQGDDFFVMAYINVGALALYQAAYKFSNIPATEITHLISQVTFPAYSKIKNDIPRLCEAYFKILQFNACLSIPIAALIFILSPEFVTLFLDPEWQPIIPVMQTLTIFGLSRSIGATTGPVFQAVGRPDLITKIGLCKLVFLAIIIFPLTRKWGIVGTSTAIIIASVGAQPVIQFLILKILQSNLQKLCRVLVFPAIATIPMLAAIVWFKSFHQEISIGWFISMVITGIITYITGLLFLDYLFTFGIRKIIREQLASIRK